jgi:hypothetical protein
MQATVRLELRSADGSVREVRRARNSVMKLGAELVARLFAGTAASGITHMGVGTNGSPQRPDFGTETLDVNVDRPDDVKGDAMTPVAPADVKIAVDETRRLIVVKLHATLPKEAAIGTLREAGLLAAAGQAFVLYNRVTFAPITKSDDHELTMFWEVTFPYGDLNWM